MKPKIIQLNENVLNTIKNDLISDIPSDYINKSFSDFLNIINIISSELILSELVTKIMEIAIQNTNTQTAYLLINKENQFFIERKISQDQRDFQLLESAGLDSLSNLQKAIINYVIENKNVLLINNVNQKAIFEDKFNDLKNESNLFLCLPLINKTNLVGIIYIENIKAFQDEKINFLKLLSSQIAISIENAIQYQKLLNSEEYFQGMILSNHVGMMITRENDGKILYSNKKVNDFLGLPPKEVEKLFTIPFYPNADNRKILLDKVKQQGFIENYEVHLKKADGTPFWILINMKPIIYKGESALITSLIDITSYKELEERNKKIQKEVAILSEQVHNSIKNKLDSISGRLSLFTKKFGNNLNQNILDQLAIIDGLVSHSANECKNILFTIKNPNCRIITLIREIDLRARLSLSPAGKNYTISSDNISENKIVSSDVLQYLLDAYSEALNNIVKHANANKVDIYISYSNKELQISIKDDGIGFNYEKNEKKSLGLELIDQYTKNLNASFEVISKVGIGTLFWISAKID